MTALKWKAFCTSLHWTHTTSPCPHFSLRSLIASSFWFHKAHFHLFSPRSFQDQGCLSGARRRALVTLGAMFAPGFQDFTKCTACLCREGWASQSFLASWNKQYLLFFHLLEFCPRAERNPWYIVGVHWWMSKTEVANSYLRRWSLDDTVKSYTLQKQTCLVCKEGSIKYLFFLLRFFISRSLRFTEKLPRYYRDFSGSPCLVSCY